MPYAQVRDLSMYYEELGPAEGQPLILLHGAGGTSDDPVGGWAGLAPLLAERFHVYCIEHRGHGRTNNPAGYMTFEQIGDDIAEFVEQLGLAPAHIAGISDGGVVALDCGLRRPQLTRTVIAVGANYSVHEGIRAVASSLDPDDLEKREPEAAAEFGRRHDQGKHPGYWKELLRQIIANNTTNPAWTEDDLRRISRPTLLIAGENDPFATAEQMAVMKREIPGAEWLIVNHAGHPVQFELPEIIGPRIVDFLGRQAS
jgi:pimeloyl-ACP methyl ester carboxylesterase